MSQSPFTPSYIKQNLMGPNVLLMLDELCAAQLPQSPDARICDLGCGAGLSSLAIANACTGTVYAVDSWNTPEQNRERFDAFPFGARIQAIQADAPELPFDQGFFDTLVCLDSYNYFGRAEGVIDRVASYVKPGGTLFLGIAGLKRPVCDADQKIYGLSWTPEQMDYLKTPGWWRTLLEQSAAVRIDRLFRLDCHEQMWRDWLACDNEYAQGDRAACEAGALDMMCTIGIQLTSIG